MLAAIQWRLREELLIKKHRFDFVAESGPRGSEQDVLIKDFPKASDEQSDSDSSVKSRSDQGEISSIVVRLGLLSQRMKSQTLGDRPLDLLSGPSPVIVTLRLPSHLHSINP